MRFPIPASVPVADYARIWELRLGATINAIQPLTEHDWRVRSTALKLVGPAEGARGRSQAHTPGVLHGDRTARFSPEETVLLNRLEEAGVLQAFAEVHTAVLEASSQGSVKDIDRAFLGYLKSVVPYDAKIPPAVHDQFAVELGGKVTFFQSNSIVMVLVDGGVCRFVPVFAIKSTGDRPLSVAFGEIRIYANTPLAQWNKKRLGCVPPGQSLPFRTFMRSLDDSQKQPVAMQPVESAPSLVQQILAEHPGLTPPIDLEKVSFRERALDRFAEQFPRQIRNGTERGALLALAGATEVGSISSVEKVRRTIAHRFQEAMYFRNGKCRFVVQEIPESGTFEVVTIEVAYR